MRTHFILLIHVRFEIERIFTSLSVTVSSTTKITFKCCGPESIETHRMAKDALLEDRSAVFKIFEESLSDVQRQLLLRNPDLLNPELIGQLYRASLERLPTRVTEPPFSEGDDSIGELRELREIATKRSRKMVNSWMTFRCK